MYLHIDFELKTNDKFLYFSFIILSIFVSELFSSEQELIESICFDIELSLTK